ncbi:uncharacterized protein EI97DRAFT_208048 [Westerdykella ornata]|uniref:Cell wall proline rich protein n=1 Tax=Westerdykella ornata TaxID=318751 RepID=A0A6A6J7G7_WESOR|nr:uncharacterized protein EI97DRAFT_208048 [Westerdykella ornata]KAF2272520.1 hypothetical protein EI97DRAFT_208048 [Westerdykella ornata]
MAQIALPRQQVTQAPESPGVGSPLYQRRRTSNAGPVELIPNPEFTFPQRGPDASFEPTPTSTSRPMSLQPSPAGRRASAPGPKQKSVSALPDFTFNPAGSATSPNARFTPPHSPMGTPTTPSRPIGHRRGGSELIGGRVGGIPLLSSSPSPTREGVLSSSAPLPPGPPAVRRGHAHRRSGAISSHDLSAIMRSANPSAQPTSGSAPVTPHDGDQFVFGHSVDKSISQPSLRDTGLFSEDTNSPPRRPPSRARVGFSEKVEYIRPLSTISSETETSMSTIRGHSATGSLSSIVSTGATTPPRLSRPPLTTTIETEERPSTAGAILDMSPRKGTHFGGDLFTRKRPMSAVPPGSPTVVFSPTSSHEPAKRRSFFRLEPRRTEPMLAKIPTSASDPALSASFSASLPSPMKDDAADKRGQRKEKLTLRKTSKKPRKVKSWANSIIYRKGKHNGKPKARAPTPPLGALGDGENLSSDSEDWDFEANFDVDNTVTIVDSSEQSTPRAKYETDIASWKPRALKRVDSDTMSPVIDLDAALGPFNTPDGSNPRVTQRGFGAHRRALHSAGGLLQNHRRTESAPELVPFELRTAAVKSSSTMADVFEEDEPEEEAVALKNSKPVGCSNKESHDSAEEPKIQLVESDESHKGTAIQWNFTDGLGIKRERARQSEKSEQLSPLQVPAQLPKEKEGKKSLDVSPVEVVEDHEEPRTSSLTHSSDSTVTPQLTAEEGKQAQPVMTLPLPLPHQSLMTPDTFTSSFSSPDFRSSQASFDTPRLGTSASSMTDYRTLPSPRFSEPGPEMRVSVDDVPSLSSSRSTASAMPTGFPLLPPRRPSERSSSLCSVPSELDDRRRKRSSIASLSRLINGSSFGEKSKLSIEQRPHSEYLEPAKEAKKKHRRLSKLMFWKPKDSSEP